MATLKITKEDRFKTYEKALELCENWVKDTYDLDTKPSLCLLLPCIYFDLENYNGNVIIDGKSYYWACDDTIKWFPEIKKFAKKVDSGFYKSVSEINAARIEFLKTLLNKP